MMDFDRVARVIEYLTEHRREQPSLEELAAKVELSPAHFQRLFVRWAGVSPKKFLQLLTVHAVRRRLLEGRSVLDAALDVGLSGPGRLHDLTVAFEAASPGEIKAGGAGWTVTAGIAASPFGDCLIAVSPRGICQLDFVDCNDPDGWIQELREQWPRAEVRWSDADAESAALDVFEEPRSRERTLKCFVKGSPFQIQVWRALLKIPVGQFATYQRIAEAIGRPTASRAVGTAVGSNPVGYLIPCHRVIRKTGAVGGYRWGDVRKQAILAREIAQADR